MPFDSEGNFSRLHNWEDDRINDIDIVTDHMDEEDDNFAAGLSECFLKNGLSKMKADFDAGNFKVRNVANGSASTDAVNKSQLDKATSNLDDALTALMNKLWRVGDIKASVKNANHDNWFLCNGQAINRVTYSDLFALIGTKFGAGDGVNTFNLPDYRGKFLRGLGGDAASDIYTTQAEGLPNITQSNVPLLTSKLNSGFLTNTTQTTQSMAGGGGFAGLGVVNFEVDASKANAIYGASSHVTPINQAVNYFIKVKLEA